MAKARALGRSTNSDQGQAGRRARTRGHIPRRAEASAGRHTSTCGLTANRHPWRRPQGLCALPTHLTSVSPCMTCRFAWPCVSQRPLSNVNAQTFQRDSCRFIASKLAGLVHWPGRVKSYSTVLLRPALCRKMARSNALTNPSPLKLAEGSSWRNLAKSNAFTRLSPVASPGMRT